MMSLSQNPAAFKHLQIPYRFYEKYNRDMLHQSLGPYDWTVRLHSQCSVKLQCTEICPNHTGHTAGATLCSSELPLRLSILLLPMTSQGSLFLACPPAWNTPWGPISWWRPKLHNPCPDANGKPNVPLPGFCAPSGSASASPGRGTCLHDSEGS